MNELETGESVPYAVLKLTENISVELTEYTIRNPIESIARVLAEEIDKLNEKRQQLEQELWELSQKVDDNHSRRFEV